MTARSAQKQSAVCPVYLLGGPDAFLVARQAEQLIDRLLSEDQKPMALWQPPPDELPDIAEIFDELRTLPFLADRRVVVIRDAESFISDHRDRLEKYLDNPSPTGVLILVVGKVDSRTRLTKAVAKLGGVMQMGEMKPQELPRFASDYCRANYDKILDHSAARMLVQLAGDEAGRICSELEKLTIFAGDKKSISPEDVEALIGHNRVFGAFDVIDAIILQKTDEALRRLRNMFESDKSTEYTVLGAFAYHFRKLFTARAFLDKGLPRQAIAKKAGIWGPYQDQFFAQVRMVSLPQAGRILVKLGRMDFLIKTGRTTAPSAMERMILGIAPLFSGR